MMQRYLLSICLVAGLLVASNAQERYLGEVFDDVTVTTDVLYGVNATVALLTDPDVGEAIPQPLYADIYEPTGDDYITARPLIIMTPSGNFLPPLLNGGCSGTRKDDMNVELATRLAKAGYVVAIIDYRLGWNPIASEQTERVFTLINAVLRGLQDCRTAARFFRMTAEDMGNPYRIDPDRVVSWGTGTGGYLSLAAAVLDTITDTYIPKFFVGTTPMVIEEINGDINGETVGIVPPMGYPAAYPPGDTLCYPNHVGYSSDYQLIVNMGGAMGDLSWVKGDEPPIISYHVPTDPNAPYNTAIVNVPPPINLPVVSASGAGDFQPLLNANGTNDSMDDASITDEISNIARQRNGGLPGFMPLPSSDPESSGDWSFTNVPEPYGIAGSDCPSSPEEKATAMAVIDTILQYFYPRAFNSLNLTTSVEELAAPAAFGLQAMPIPATNQVRIQVNADLRMDAIQLFDINGRLLKQVSDINADRYDLRRENLPNGIYIAKVRIGKQIATQRLVFH
jgi:hypothetical protein